MLRRSDFIAATYALSFVLANFGIAIAARMPMMTTTIRSSMSVKPFLVIIGPSRRWAAYRGSAFEHDQREAICPDRRDARHRVRAGKSKSPDSGRGFRVSMKI